MGLHGSSWAAAVPSCLLVGHGDRKPGGEFSRCFFSPFPGGSVQKYHVLSRNGQSLIAPWL